MQQFRTEIGPGSWFQIQVSE